MSDAHRDDSLREIAGAGFTLLEVMAAVAILSIWYLVIANAAVQGLRAEGENRRRLEAGLIADAKLAEVEASVLGGSSPRDGEDFSEEDIYQVTVLIAPFVDAVYGAAPPSNAAPLVPGARAPRPEMKQLIGSSSPDLGKYLKQVDVKVEWAEGSELRELKRTTVVFDLTSARRIYEDPALQAARNGPLGDPSELEE